MAEPSVPLSQYRHLVREHEQLAVAEATVPLSQYRDLLREHEKLQRRYQDSLAQLQKAKKKIQEARSSVKQWQRYIDSHPKYVESKRKPAAPNVPSPLSFATPAGGRSSSTTGPDLPTTGRASPLPDPVRSLNTSAEPGSSDELNNLQKDPPLLHHPSSQTTDPGSDPPELDSLQVKPEPDDYEDPIVVSARTIRKPRAVEPTVHANHRGSYSDPYKMKREDVEASQFMPHVPKFVSALSHTQASDLDTLVREIHTPRKRRKMLHGFDEGIASPAICSPPPRANFQPPVDENTPPSPAFTDQSALIVSHDICGQQRKADHHQGSQTPTNSQPRSSGGPLQPLSTNTPTLPRTSAVSTKGRQREASRESLTRRLQDMGEDDTDIRNAGPRSAKKGKRLDDLLQGNETPQGRDVIASRALSSSTRAKLFQASPTTVPQSTTNEETPVTTHRSRKTPALRTPISPIRPTSRSSRRSDPKPPRSPQPEEEPLRSRPLTRLGLDDFRVNPLYAGTDFAFNTSVRDRASRACLPGCTKACCATLQRFAPHADTSTSAAWTDDDEALLRSWLGDDDTSALSASQKRDMVATARAEKFARQHGRHRQVFERAKTPPGFWDTDMPSTQEVESRREQSRAHVREEVKGRWMEALKAGGRGKWRFRDEV